MQDINLTEDSRDVAIINATLTAAAQYVSTKHTIPLNTVLSGMSMGSHLKPAISVSVQAWQDRQIQKQASAPTPAPIPAPEPKQKAPAPIPIPPPPMPEPVAPSLDPTHPAYAHVAARSMVSPFKPEPIPSAFVPDPVVPPPAAPELAATEAPAAKKRGRPKKAS